MSVEIRKYNSLAELTDDPVRLSERMAVWFRHYMDPTKVTGIFVQDEEVQLVTGRVDSVVQLGDGTRAVEFAEADIDKLGGGMVHMIETFGEDGERVMVQATNLGEMGPQTLHPGMQVAWN